MSVGPRPLTVDEVLAIHDASLERFGGLPGVRDEGMLGVADGSVSYESLVEWVRLQG